MKQENRLLQGGFFISKFMKNTIKHNKIIGVLGGLGPETTSEFYLDLIKTAQHIRRPAVAIWSLPLNRKKEREYIASGKHSDHYLQELDRGAQRLVRAGVDFIVIPCNTVHEFHPVLTKAVSIPIPNLIDIAAREVKRRNWKRVLLLATSRTLQTKLYQTVLKKSSVRISLPTKADQKRLDVLIQKALSFGTTNDAVNFLKALQEKAGTKNILLGCTDLQLLLPPSKQIIDSMHELVLHTAMLIKSRN